MKILVDEMWDGLEENLKEQGHDAYSVKKLREGDPNLAGDPSIRNYARENGMVLVTYDAKSGRACRESGIPCVLIAHDDIIELVLTKLKDFG